MACRCNRTRFSVPRPRDESPCGVLASISLASNCAALISFDALCQGLASRMIKRLALDGDCYSRQDHAECCVRGAVLLTRPAVLAFYSRRRCKTHCKNEVNSRGPRGKSLTKKKTEGDSRVRIIISAERTSRGGDFTAAPKSGFSLSALCSPDNRLSPVLFSDCCSESYVRTPDIVTQADFPMSAYPVRGREARDFRAEM